MATPPMYRLPPELLLQIARDLRAPNSARLVHVRNLCLVSKKLLPIAQEVLYTDATLPIVCCGSHPTVNPALQLLCTLLERPALALYVKSLRLSVVRRNISKLYDEKCAEQHCDLRALRALCCDELSKLGYREGHPWWSSLQNNVESAYAGLLLCMIPNLVDLQYEVKELHRGYSVTDPIPAFFGVCSLPGALAASLKTTLQELCTADLAFLRSMDFDNLRILRLQSVSVPTLLQLNGPNTMRGTLQLSELWVGVSAYLLDKECLNDMHVCFRDLIESFGCYKLSTLKVRLLHEEYCVLQTPSFDVQNFVDQLSCLELTVKVLEIDLDPQEDDDQWDFILSHLENPVSSLRNFTSVETLKIPQDFLICEPASKAGPHYLPRNLRCLEIVSPTRNFIAWATSILEAPEEFHDLREIFLHCREGVHTSASFFLKRVNPVWPDLFHDCDIMSYVKNFEDRTVKSLLDCYLEDPGYSDDDDDDDDDDGGDSGDDSDEDMADLITNQVVDAETADGQGSTIAVDDLD